MTSVIPTLASEVEGETPAMRIENSVVPAGRAPTNTPSAVRARLDSLCPARSTNAEISASPGAAVRTSSSPLDAPPTSTVSTLPLAVAKSPANHAV